MSNIQENLKKILAAVYGKDVRQAIHDSIHDCYEDGKAGAIDLIARQNIEALKSAVGTPCSASSLSEMIDSSKIYVYTGEESGYINGHWYYYYNSKWNDGGVYQSISSDSIGTEQLMDESVSNEKLAKGSITEEKLSEELKTSLLSGGDASINLYIGLSEVLNVFKNTVFKTANTDAFKTLESSIEGMKPEGLISLTYHLTNCKISNQKPYLIEGTPYVGTVTIYDNTEFEYITVKMGGVDVTSSVLSGMEIKIPKVTGDIEITASSRSLYLADGISRMNYIMSDGNGDAYVNTDWVMSNISEKMEIGVILPETSEYSADNDGHPFFGVNADSAFSSVYSAIELGCAKIQASDTKADYVAQFKMGWFKYQATVVLGGGYYDRDLQKYSVEPHYISLVNGSQNVWADENMTTLFNPKISAPTTQETGTESKIPPFPLWLFRSNIQDVAYNSSKKINWRCPKVKITCFKVWDADGSLVVNMRPAKREKDNVFGFYDTVRERFFTNEATTGSLVGA